MNLPRKTVKSTAARWTTVLVMILGGLGMGVGCDVSVAGKFTGNNLDMNVDVSGCGLSVKMDMSDMPLVVVNNYTS
jgi:hypothetical protein